MKPLIQIVLALIAGANIAHSQIDPFGQQGDGTTVSLVSEVNQTAPGARFTIAIELEHEEGWHSYYKNPGGPGLPLEFDWQLPAGYVLEKLHWPVPALYQSGDTQFHIYEGKYILLADIAVPASAQVGTTAELQITPTWQLCDDMGCAPPESRLASIKVALGDKEIPSTVHADYFKAAREKLPQTDNSWDIEAKIKDSELVLTIRTADGSVAIIHSLHYIDNSGLTDPSKKQTLTDRGDAYILKAPLEQSAQPEAQISGILLFDEGNAISVSTPLTGSAAKTDAGTTSSAAHGLQNLAPTDAEIAAAAEMYDAAKKIDFVLLDGTKEKAHTLFTALGFIFIGGLLLNLMPCVFPVLGLKVMGFAQQAGSEPQKIKVHGLVFMSGVIVSMWILASIIYILIFTFGRDVNWGEQLTSPVFLAAIIMLLYVFGLNMAGLFEIGTSLTGTGSELQAKKGYSGSFFSGVLTTLIATPCSGPFLGSVMGYTLKQPAFQGMLIFTVFALGISSPYVVLAFFPKLINKLPKPGAWMVTFKQLMAFALFATAAYFFRSFAKITGTGGASWLLMATVVVGLALWAYGRFGTPYTPKAKRIVWGLSFPLLVAAGGFLMTKSATQERAPATPLTGSSWYPGVVELNRSKGRIVWVDYTADW